LDVVYRHVESGVYIQYCVEEKMLGARLLPGTFLFYRTRSSTGHSIMGGFIRSVQQLKRAIQSRAGNL